MKHPPLIFITLLFLTSICFSYTQLQVSYVIQSSGVIGFVDTYSRDYMLQRFYMGGGYSRWFMSWGQGATAHYGRAEGYTYLLSDGNLSLTDPTGQWPAINPSIEWYAVGSLNTLFSKTREIVTGREFSLKNSNPSSYPLIPLYSLWIYNFENITESGVANFLIAWSNYLMTLESELQIKGENRQAWSMWEPCWEYNQDPYGSMGGGWGSGSQHVRGWNILPADYRRVMKMIVDTRNQLGIKNIVIVSHAALREYRAFTDPSIQQYITAIRDSNVDVVSFSAYNDDPVGVSFPRAKQWWDAIGGNKPLSFTEFNKANRPEDSTFINAAFEALNQYAMIKFFSWWDTPMSSDQATHDALVTESAKWNAYSGTSITLPP